MHHPRSRKAAALVLSAVLGAGLAACGSSDSDSTTDATTAATAAAGAATTAGDSLVSEASANVDAAQADQKFQEQTPVAKPPASSGRIVIIPCAAALEGCMNAARGAEAAAKSLGWEATIVDGKNDPQTTNAAVQRAVAQKATGIIVVSSPQSMYSEGLAAAKKAGIPVVTTTAGNKVGADGVDYDLSDPKEVAAAGSLAADYVISQSDGKANVVVLNDTSFTLLQPFQESLMKRLGECSGCKVEQVVEFTGADVTTRLAGLVSTALERHPDTNWVISPYGAIAIFASNAIRQSGRDVKIISYASDAANNDLIRKDDVQVAAIDKALGYGGWRAVDTLVRLQGGEQMGTYEEPHKLLDKSNLPPAGQPWDGDEDYQAMFKQLWGGQ